MLLRTVCAIVMLAAASAPAADEPSPLSPVLLIGDSMMKLPGLAIRKELSRIPGIEAETFSGIGTGLARLDAFDWMAKIDALCEQYQPRTAVVALGANDRQPMQLPDSLTVVQPDTAEWEAEYAARIGQAMDRFKAGGCTRIIWLLLPPMRDEAVQQFAERINALVRQEAESRSGVVLFDVGSIVADRRTGGYTERITDPRTAASQIVRDRDGIHLTPQGARMLATALIKEYWR